MIEIIPAIIPRSFKELEERVKEVSYYASVIHVDALDGIFVSGKSWPYVNREGEFENILKEQDGLPEWQTVDYEVDLMVENPEVELERWIQAGVKRAILHIEGVKDMNGLLDNLYTNYKYSVEDGFDGFEIGLAIGLDTPLESIYPFIEKVHFVQCMGIKKIGFQGNPFDEQVLERIKTLRAAYPHLVIVGDGGVTLENAIEWVRAGANRLVSGSAIYESDNIHDTIEELRTLDSRI